MDPQTIAIVAIVAVGAGLLGAIVPLMVVLIRRVDQLSNEVAQTNRMVTARPRSSCRPTDASLLTTHQPGPSWDSSRCNSETYRACA